MRRRYLCWAGVIALCCLSFFTGHLLPIMASSIRCGIGRLGTAFTTGDSSSQACHMKPLDKPLMWTVTSEMLQATPPWRHDDGKPPSVSVLDAIRISGQALSQQFTNSYEWEVQEISMDRLDSGDRWFYKVSWRQREVYGDSLVIPVLMSGVAVPVTADDRDVELQQRPPAYRR